MKVSILINNFNYGGYILDSVNSAFNQVTTCEIEVIVYDDASNDESIGVLKSIDNEFIFLQNQNKQKGVYPGFYQANAINKSFEVSSGEIICLLDSDDVFLNNKVEQIVEIFRHKPDVICVQHKLYEINEKGYRTGLISKDLIGDTDHLKEIHFSGRLDSFFMQTSGLSFRRQYLEQVLPIIPDEFPLIWSDVRLTRSALFYGKVYTIMDPLGEYRVHGNNDSLKLRNKAFQNDFESQLYAYFNNLSVRYTGDNFCRRNKYISVLKLFIVSIRSNDDLKYKCSFILNKLFSLILKR